MQSWGQKTFFPPPLASRGDIVNVKSTLPFSQKLQKNEQKRLDFFFPPKEHGFLQEASVWKYSIKLQIKSLDRIQSLWNSSKGRSYSQKLTLKGLQSIIAPPKSPMSTPMLQWAAWTQLKDLSHSQFEYWYTAHFATAWSLKGACMKPDSEKTHGQAAWSSALCCSMYPSLAWAAIRPSDWV